MLHALCTEQKLWKDMCNSTWSSINDPHVRHVISMFPGGYQSFYANSIPTTFHHRPNTTKPYQSCSSPTSELLSAVDIRFKNKIICSRVQVTKIVTNDFLAPLLWIDLLGRKETVQVPVKFQANSDNFPSDLEKSITLSWILIDPTRTCSVNLSSQRPVLVEWHNTPEEVQLFYVTILPGNSLVGSSDPVQCRIMVTCGAEEGGEMHVREVNMQVQDMDGVNLSREDSLVILQGAMGCERRKVGKGRERYEDFMQMKRERRERNERREKSFFVVLIMEEAFYSQCLFVQCLLNLRNPISGSAGRWRALNERLTRLEDIVPNLVVKFWRAKRKLRHLKNRYAIALEDIYRLGGRVKERRDHEERDDAGQCVPNGPIRTDGP
ncbi:hypothetical protein LguiB_031568 [Lonicera macranthoides]